MSATEIPILDPKNIIVRSSASIETPAEYVERYGKAVYDPVAKIGFGLGRTWEDSRYPRNIRDASAYYIPDLRPELLPEQRTQAQIEQLSKLGRIDVMSHQIGVTDEIDNIFLYVVHAYSFGGVGLPNEDFVSDEGYIARKFGDINYKFWPDGVVKKNHKAAQYFLHLLFKDQIANLQHSCGNAIKEGRVTHCGIAVDQALADFMGLDDFPDAEQLHNVPRLNEDLIVVLKKDVRDAG